MTDASTTAAPAAPAATPPAAAPAAPVATSAPDTSDHFVPQKDVDRIVGERLGRERQKFETEFNSKTEDLKKATRAEVETEFNTKLVHERTRSLAKDLGFHDPADGLSVIDAAKLPLKDGAPDEDAIKAALTKLATDKTYLVKAPSTNGTKTTSTGKPKLPTGNAPEGGDGKGEGKLTAAEALRALAAQKHR